MSKLLKQAWAVYPSVKLRGFKIDAKTKKKKLGIIKQLLFGDFIRPYIKGNEYESITVSEKQKKVNYIKVRARGVDGYLQEDQMQAERILEVNFIDVGQGDGCHIVTPSDEHFLIDAGPGDNMYRFLKWRFNLKNAKISPPPFTVIISHSDADHYKGFGKIFTATAGSAQQFSIKKIYHNGMVELTGTGTDSLGKIVTKNNEDFVTDLCDTNADYKKRAVAGKGQYIQVLNKSTAAKESLRKGSKALFDDGKLKIDVLGPVARKINGNDALPVFEKNKGKTKNGHSVILKLTMGKLRLLLGGDLNTESENYLLQEYSKIDVAALKAEFRKKTTSAARKKQLETEIRKAIIIARDSFEVDVAKSCHHGSADFTSEFLEALNPLVTVISSGDDEPHVHPRPDTLGTIGKHSRGERSLIFSTELSRSGKEFLEITKEIAKKKKERVVVVYGMINVRTDGEKVIIAQKLERKASGRDWDIHKLEWNDDINQFEYIQFLKRE